MLKPQCSDRAPARQGTVRVLSAVAAEGIRGGRPLRTMAQTSN